MQLDNELKVRHRRPELLRKAGFSRVSPTIVGLTLAKEHHFPSRQLATDGRGPGLVNSGHDIAFMEPVAGPELSSFHSLQVQRNPTPQPAGAGDCISSRRIP